MTLELQVFVTGLCIFMQRTAPPAGRDLLVIDGSQQRHSKDGKNRYRTHLHEHDPKLWIERAVIEAEGEQPDHRKVKYSKHGGIIEVDVYDLKPRYGLPRPDGIPALRVRNEGGEKYEELSSFQQDVTRLTAVESKLAGRPLSDDAPIAASLELTRGSLRSVHSDSIVQWVGGTRPPDLKKISDASRWSVRGLEGDTIRLAFDLFKNDIVLSPIEGQSVIIWLVSYPRVEVPKGDWQTHFKWYYEAFDLGKEVPTHLAHPRLAGAPTTAAEDDEEEGAGATTFCPETQYP